MSAVAFTFACRTYLPLVELVTGDGDEMYDAVWRRQARRELSRMTGLDMC